MGKYDLKAIRRLLETFRHDVCRFRDIERAKVIKGKGSTYWDFKRGVVSGKLAAYRRINNLITYYIRNIDWYMGLANGTNNKNNKE